MLAQFLSQIAQDRRGSVAQIFALALIPVAFMAGAAIDYTRSVTERSELQVAVDAAVLAGARSRSAPAARPRGGTRRTPPAS
ncbi:MAG: hypothetical protein JF604_27045 [Bradyrhizobium sp.]|nr:hypothetical protein [Bradyrhizobium sp.]